MLQLRAYDNEGVRLVLVEHEHPRCGGNILSEVESVPLSFTEAQGLYLRTRLAPLGAGAELLRLARSHAPQQTDSREATKRMPPITLTAPGLEALAYLLQEAQERARDRASRSGVVYEALQQLARSRGWQPSAGHH